MIFSSLLKQGWNILWEVHQKKKNRFTRSPPQLNDRIRKKEKEKKVIKKMF